MATFLTGDKLNAIIGRIMDRAEKYLILVSPFIRLHPHYKEILKVKRIDPDLQIIIVFGKSGADYTKSIYAKDLFFLKEFPNIEIRYEENLHAKYYANESSSVLTTMNLYDYSQENNIEAGVYARSNIFNNIFGDSLDNQAYSHFRLVIQNSELLFKKTPIFDRGMFHHKKKYKGSQVEIDQFTNKSQLF